MSQEATELLRLAGISTMASVIAILEAKAVEFMAAVGDAGATPTAGAAAPPAAALVRRVGVG
jgi:hypothetical protein